MFELQQSEFHRVALLFESPPYAPSIPNSVIAGIGHGKYSQTMSPGRRRPSFITTAPARSPGPPYSRSYWKSASDFEQHGLGFCAMFQGAIVGMCYTAFAWGVYHDIDIMTAEEHQRRGLGTLLATTFIDHCVKNGLVPNWDCWTNNEASMALAERLGFEPRVEVSVYHGWEQ